MEIQTLGNPDFTRRIASQADAIKLLSGLETLPLTVLLEDSDMTDVTEFEITGKIGEIQLLGMICFCVWDGWKK